MFLHANASPDGQHRAGGSISLEQHCQAQDGRAKSIISAALLCNPLLQEMGGYDHWNKHFTFLCSLVWPLIASDLHYDAVQFASGCIAGQLADLLSIVQLEFIM